MSRDTEKLSGMIRRFCSVNAVTGKVDPGYFAVYSGDKSSSLSNRTANVPFNADIESVSSDIAERVEAARDEGHRLVYVRAYQHGGGGYSASVRMEAGEAALSGGGDLAELAQLGHAAVGMNFAITTLVRQNADLMGTVVALATDSREREQAATLRLAQLQYQRPGLVDGLAAAAGAVAPVLEPVSRVWADALVKAAMAGAFRPPPVPAPPPPPAGPTPAAAGAAPPPLTPDAHVRSAMDSVNVATEALATALQAYGPSCQDPATLSYVRDCLARLAVAAGQVQSML